MAHDSRDLSRLHLAERAGNDAEVLAESGDLSRAYVAVAGDHAVRRQNASRHAEGGRRVRSVEAKFLESALIKERLKPLASRQQTFGVQRFQLLGTDVFGQLGALGAQLFNQIRSYRHRDS
jgi:hypothetical protein